MFPVWCPKAPKRVGDVPSGPKLLLYLFPVFWSGGADQILFLEFTWDGPADSSGEFVVQPEPVSDTVMTDMFLQLPGLSNIASFNPTCRAS